MMLSKVSRNFVLLAPPGCGEVSANKSANVGALIFIVTLFGSVLVIAYHPPFVQRFPKKNELALINSLAKNMSSISRLGMNSVCVFYNMSKEVRKIEVLG